MPLAIAGAGLVTSLGDALPASCAAIRAGITRPRPLDAVVDDGEGNAVAPTGHPVPGAEGFFQTGAWVRLASAAMDDLARRIEAAPDWRRTAVIAALPSIEADRFRWSLERIPAAPREFLLDPLVRLSIPGASPSSWVASGHASLAEAFMRAETLLAAGQFTRCAVVAVDSYIDAFALAWLLETRRLKTPEHPSGLEPGEAAGVFLVEHARTGRTGAQGPNVRIEAVALERAGSGPPADPRTASRPAAGSGGRIERPPRPPGAALGRTLAAALVRVLPPGPSANRASTDIYLDLNGETWKAEAWGFAAVALGSVLDLDRCRVLLPATILGDTGAASAGVALALALHEIHRHGRGPAIILSLSDSGDASAIRIGLGH